MVVSSVIPETVIAHCKVSSATYFDPNTSLKTDYTSGIVQTHNYTEREYLNFLSHHSLTQKAAIFQKLSGHHSHHTSTSALTLENDRVFYALSLNDYREHVLWYYLRRCCFHHLGSTNSPPDWKGTVAMLYHRGVSELLRRTLASLKIRLCFRLY